MARAQCGKILHVDLARRTFESDTIGADIYRRFGSNSGESNG